MPIFTELERALLEFSSLFRKRIVAESSTVIELLCKNMEWKPIDDSCIRCSIASVDSSFTIIETRLGIVYVVQGIAIAYSLKDKASIHLKVADVGLIIPEASSTYTMQRFAPKKILALIAQCIELMAMKDVVHQVENPLVLLDGSAISFISSIPKTCRGYRIVSTIFNEMSLEMLVSLKLRLLKELNSRFITVFVAKSSNASFYLNSRYPDLYALELARLLDVVPYTKSGFSVPKVVELSELKKVHRLSEENLKLYGFKSMQVLYVRLKDRAPAFQLTFLKEIREDELEKVVKCLKSWAPLGYPIPLESVHKLSKLDRKRLRSILESLGIPIISGREILE